MAALYLDNSYLTCKKFIRNLLENQVDWSDLIFNDTNSWTYLGILSNDLFSSEASIFIILGEDKTLSILSV